MSEKESEDLFNIRSTGENTLKGNLEHLATALAADSTQPL